MDHRTNRIAKAIAKTNPKAAQEYRDGADRRNAINEAVAPVFEYLARLKKKMER